MIFLCEGKLKAVLLVTKVRCFSPFFEHSQTVDGRVVTISDQNETRQDL